MKNDKIEQNEKNEEGGTQIVRFQVDNRTAHVSPDTIDSRLVCVLVVPRGVVACGRATHGLPS